MDSVQLQRKRPVSYFDPAVWDIVEQASPSLKLFIENHGGLLRALAKTKDFVVNLADDTFSLKEFMNSTQPQPIASLDTQPSAIDSHKVKGLVKLGIVKRTSTKAVFVECPGLDTVVWCPVTSIICPDSGRYLDSGATVAGKLNVGDKVEVCLKRQALRNDCSWAAQSTKLIDEAQHVAAAATIRELARSDPSPSAITSLSSSLLSHSSEGQQSGTHCVDHKKLQESGLLNERKSSTTCTLKDSVTEAIEDLPSSANSLPLQNPCSKSIKVEVTSGAKKKKKKGKQGVHNQQSSADAEDDKAEQSSSENNSSLPALTAGSEGDLFNSYSLSDHAKVSDITVETLLQYEAKLLQLQEVDSELRCFKIRSNLTWLQNDK